LEIASSKNRHNWSSRPGLKINRSKFSSLRLASLQILTRNLDVGVFLDYLVHELSKRFREFTKLQIYNNLYYFFRRLSKLSVVELKKIDGLVWIKPRAVDLIFLLQEFFKPNSRSLKKFQNPLVAEARRFLYDKIELDESDWNYLFDLFRYYLDEISDKVIVLHEPDFNQFLLLKYRTRFDRRYFKRTIKLYRRVWEYYTKKYNVGVFLTLTVDPRDYANLVQVRYGVSQAFNRFKSWLKKRLGFNPPHVAVFEFQNNGRLHLHVVLFGVSRIADKKTELTPELVRIGFGKINYIYKIIKGLDGKWGWINRPRNTRCSPDIYLEKYLRKSMDYLISLDSGSGVDSPNVETMKISMYWCLLVRFFTYSRFEKKMVASRVVGFSSYVFIMSVRWFEIPDYIIYNALNPDVLDRFSSGVRLVS